MKCIRPIEPEDLEGFEKLAFTSGPGITNLPKDKRLLKERINRSQEAFANNSDKLGDDFYIFVLEDTDTKQIVGTSGIRALTGIEYPLHFYHQESIILDNSQSMPLLQPKSYTRGPSELIGLYLLPDYRKHGTGPLLSLSRLLFIAAFPRRFDAFIKAEIRGWIDEKQHSPFWEGIGRHFLNLSLEEVLRQVIYNRKIVEQILSPFPILIPLLPKEVQSVIGVTHPHTVPAQKMLEREGFTLTGEIDVIDGGPVLGAQTQELKSVKQSSLKKVKEIKSIENKDSKIISNEKIQFRATLSPSFIEQDFITIPPETAKLLHVSINENVRVL